jgi:uncharacterized protein HemX
MTILNDRPTLNPTLEPTLEPTDGNTNSSSPTSSPTDYTENVFYVAPENGLTGAETAGIIIAVFIALGLGIAYYINEKAKAKDAATSHLKAVDGDVFEEELL